MANKPTKYKTVLMFANNPSCRFYDTKYNIEVTLEENLNTAIKTLRSARRDRRAGVPNQEYLKDRQKNFKAAIKLCRKAELK